MYRLSVPIMNMTVKKGYWNDYLTLLKKVGAQRVWIAIDKHFAHDQAREAEYAALKENISFFEGQGFEVGAWLPALGYGGASSKKMRNWQSSIPKSPPSPATPFRTPNASPIRVIFR